MKFNPAGIFTTVLVFFIGVMFASYVWALYHTWIIIVALCAAAGWVAYAIYKSRSKRNGEDGDGGQGGVHVHFH
jgi:uncharacterized membrane protein YeaQ/YmgE (transglycosylase-associated protein family)